MRRKTCRKGHSIKCNVAASSSFGIFLKIEFNFEYIMKFLVIVFVAFIAIASALPQFGLGEGFGGFGGFGGSGGQQQQQQQQESFGAGFGGGFEQQQQQESFGGGFGGFQQQQQQQQGGFF
ncbi:hypothetical protein M5D96_003964 [Drosophila gunungcola]|uniref:Uncharacterized protein n=1 Tax=Drosophila gunungcola TaxID=103775 RepID=A0A9P9YT57_9MUSC|nr:hypothetical protein M5D96_003964 [Drosophila gunungcola]